MVYLKEYIKLRTERSNELSHLELDHNLQYVANPWKPGRKYLKGMIVYHGELSSNEPNTGESTGDFNTGESNTGEFKNSNLTWYRANKDIGPEYIFDYSSWDPISESSSSNQILIKDLNGNYNISGVLEFNDDEFIITTSGNTSYVNIKPGAFNIWQDAGDDNIYYDNSIIIGGNSVTDTDNILEALGDVLITGDLDISGKINDIDLNQFYENFQNHSHTILPVSFPGYNAKFPESNGQLSDILLSNLTDGDYLKWQVSSNRWVNTTVTVGSHALGDHSDVTSPYSQQWDMLFYDNTQWRNKKIVQDIYSGFQNPPLRHYHDGRYYTQSQLKISGGGGKVHWDNLISKPNVPDDSAEYVLMTSAGLTNERILTADEIGIYIDDSQGPRGNIIVKQIENSTLQLTKFKHNDGPDLGNVSTINFADSDILKYDIDVDTLNNKVDVSVDFVGEVVGGSKILNNISSGIPDDFPDPYVDYDRELNITSTDPLQFKAGDGIFLYSGDNTHIKNVIKIGLNVDQDYFDYNTGDGSLTLIGFPEVPVDEETVFYNTAGELSTKQRICESIKGTYDEFKALKDNNNLKQGQYYLMTDFQTIYDQPDYSDASTPKTSVITKFALVDPILLLAISENKFAKEVYRPSTPQHTLEYDFDFDVTEVMGQLAKGRITKCIDEFENSTDFDHTVIYFIRYESVDGTGEYDSFFDTGFDAVQTLMFTGQSGLNTFGNNSLVFQFGQTPFILGNNVFGENCIGNTIGDQYINNSTGDNFNNNIIGNVFQDNIIGNGFRDNSIGNAFNSNVVGTDFQDNIIGNVFQDNSIGIVFNNNTVGNAFNSNVVGTDFQDNIVGNDSQDNIIGNSFNNNTVGNSFGGNNIGDYFNSNIVGNRFIDNTIGDYFNSNTVKSSITSIDFTATSATHVYGTYDCEIFKNIDVLVRLKYMDNNDKLKLSAQPINNKYKI